jgi:hypothetical protein
MANEETTKWVSCTSCGERQKKHRVLYEKNLLIGDAEDQPPDQEEHHRLVECMGCETIKYTISISDWPASESPWGDEETELKVYPVAPGANLQRLPAISHDEATDGDGKLLIPVSVWKMYKETIEALNANIRTLAGGGLRATVEAICLDNNIRQGNLQTKIDQLTKQNLLTAAQAELLHEERYLGNAALHELETPATQDIEDGLRIVEGLINTIYILPSKAKRLKERREAKQKEASQASLKQVPAKK